MDDDGLFIQWFTPWKNARPDMSLIGLYVLADLEAAFSAGMTAEHKRVIVELFGPERAEELLHAEHKKDLGPC